jgi:regulatory protein
MWHKHGDMPHRQGRKPRPPLDARRLDEMAIFYVGRFATSRAKLISYLKRKVRERGWDDAGEPDVDAVANRLVKLGYVDDAAFALSKARALTTRGYGAGRVRQSLHAAGIGEEDGAGARDLAAAGAVTAAVKFAQRRGLGPFAAQDLDPRAREKALSAMIRAGHGFALARAILSLPPGGEVDEEQLGEAR